MKAEISSLLVESYLDGRKAGREGAGILWIDSNDDDE